MIDCKHCDGTGNNLVLRSLRCDKCNGTGKIQTPKNATYEARPRGHSDGYWDVWDANGKRLVYDCSRKSAFLCSMLFHAADRKKETPNAR